MPEPRPLNPADGIGEARQAPASETIVAISTPPGRGGIGVIRLSGPRALSIAAGLFRPAGRVADDARIRFGRFVDEAGETIDHGYLAAFRPPGSFTGEETAELWAHGSPAALRLLVQAAIALGARPATPGEFSLRAFLNGRMDVTQAEAIRDLIEARTAFQAKVAHDQVLGRISLEVNRLKDRLADVVARLEAAIEFSEEGEAGRFMPHGGPLPEVDSLRGAIEDLAGTFERGRRVRDGATVAIVGSPNAGKSSLFNRLLEEDRAIVTPVAGTTRDILEETLDLRGIPVALRDTAGLHVPCNEADAEAVRRAREAIAASDVVIVVLDGSRPLLHEERTLLADLDRARALVAINKIDLESGLGLDEALRLKKRHGAHEVSARTGAGMDALRRGLEETVSSGAAASREETFITNVRHRDLLGKAAGALARVSEGAGRGVPDEYLIPDYREALDRLGEITGEVGIDGIYERIFRNFCIGK
ncbi:MAG TPA: tRNA uridine-5-carboxymethylaminomethyl(34) synthesis GTPase MnmE [Candidatus Polarisedimenticolia bacterium]|jgi:tRNA modification GTPase|nr:tRNA uridine-5-carboxymethylaminomethyl(34) synthesis GTPase MnmE [Candidatus Polarisedimenticolia bacterium]